jgi:hypothetical protein
MSAFGGKADVTVCGNTLSRSLLGVKRTLLFATHMSAFDPKRTCRLHCENVRLPKADIEWENSNRRRFCRQPDLAGHLFSGLILNLWTSYHNAA